jgi:hypothetical protein
MFTHLVNGGSVGSCPGIGDVEQDADPAEFRSFYNDPAKPLAVQCNPLASRQLLIEYTWPVNMLDLDTGTMFNGEQLGWACPVAPGGDTRHTRYMTWSGDDTSAGGKETVLVNLPLAHGDAMFSDTAHVQLRASWYDGSSRGPASVTVSLVDPSSNSKTGGQQATIWPTPWTSCAATQWVGAVRVTVAGAPGAETMAFELIPGECMVHADGPQHVTGICLAVAEVKSCLSNHHRKGHSKAWCSCQKHHTVAAGICICPQCRHLVHNAGP